MANQLINETSPYLLQHAHNPVDWHPWNEKALSKAKEENKPVLVSIGYAACHWCHVMERESFENEETAALMNQHFINIKIDREERPDLDHIYMDAVQAMTGSGGWPLNVFLTPDGKPFYGGTYFPPVKAFNRPSWQEVLKSVVQAFSERRHEIDAQAENLTTHLLESNAFGLQQIPVETLFTEAKTKEVAEQILTAGDKEWGGFGKAPKFPQTFSIQYLLRYHYVNNLQRLTAKPTPVGEEELVHEALKQAILSLDKMIAGGIYDQAGGGFARYSTDTEWLAPHFEKMLYDNALLLSVISEAYQLTGKERYKEVINETMDFIRRELMHPDRGFYAALDADSEGVEGKFYVWDHAEVQQLLGDEADLFCDFYDITPKGNWEKKNILRVKKSIEEFAGTNNISVERLTEKLERGRKILLEERKKRIRPQLDDKIILGWNALMNTAASKAFAATGKEEYRQLAIGNMQFLLQNFAISSKGEFYHTWKNEQAKYPAFLDDYAFLIEALLQLQEVTADTGWLDKASSITQFVIDHFSEDETGFFYFTKTGQSDVIIRKKEVYDGAVPSGNSVMAYNLYHLSILLDKKEWGERAEKMLASLGNAITRYPTSFGNWAGLLLEKTAGTSEIVLTGPNSRDLQEQVLQAYIPHRVLMAAATPVPGYPLLSGKEVAGKTSIWLCRNYTCLPPVFSVKDLITLINRAPEA